MSVKDHWDDVYGRKVPSELTWYQATPQASLSLIHQTGLPSDARILDVGGGTSLLPKFLLQEGYQGLSVLDVSEKALEAARAQLGDRAREVEWIEADLLTFDPPHQWALWHDRALFHFLTSSDDRRAYGRVLEKGLKPGGHLIIATFALDGPSRCTGLDCVRYSPESLGEALGPGYALMGSLNEAHQTPKGGTQAFVYSWFQRKGSLQP